MNTEKKSTSWLDRPVHPSLPAVTVGHLLFGLIILLAIATRFYDLGIRVMSHDESLHTYFSWLLYKGDGYQHNPMMHGPGQFHLLALTYYLFGVSDFTARIPAALFSIATVWMTWYWRRYLGRAGALVAAFLLTISPMLLYYGRYVRNESYAGFAGVLLLYAVLRYLEEGRQRHLYMVVVAQLIHVLAKETFFIYTALLLVFLAVYFIVRVTRKPWEDAFRYRAFLVALTLSIILIAVGGGIAMVNREVTTVGATEVVQPANPLATTSPLGPVGAIAWPQTTLFIAGGVALIAALYFLLAGYSWDAVRAERSFGLLIVVGTLVLPTLVAFAIRPFQAVLQVQIPTSVGEVQGLTPREMGVILGFLLVAYALSVAIGQLWRADWWKFGLTFWAPFTVIYTTVFTNTPGFFTGVIGSLGYWLAQQGVQRGSQPWYYYLLITVPIYEFLPLIGTLFALGVAIWRRRRPAPPSAVTRLEDSRFRDTFSLLAWWIVGTVTALSMAGEKMPWLTYHIAWPMILLAGWGLGWLLESIPWAHLRARNTLLTLGVAIVFITSFWSLLAALQGPDAPFQGTDLTSLQNTSAFLLPAIVAAASLAGLYFLLRGWLLGEVAKVLAIVAFSLLTVLTVRASFRANYINYDNAREYLVYAHSATAVKDVIAQATQISQLTTGGMGVDLAYDASSPDTGVSWPFVWYLRDFTNQHSFDEPTRSLRDSVVVIVDAKNFDKIERALGAGYYRFDYIRMWWPNQDYFGLVSPRQPVDFPPDYSCRGALSFLKLSRAHDYSRLCSAILDPEIRAGIFDIWMNRDFTRYATATGHSDLTLPTWQPSDEMRMYIRKDVVEQVWKYGVPATTQGLTAADPYEGKTSVFAADPIIPSTVASPPMNGPRALAFAPDGSFYVVDSRNNRVLHLGASGIALGQWGVSSGNTPNNPQPASPEGTFNEPWGIAVGPDGSVYVADTWNYRVQKFTADGQFLTMWSTYGPVGQQQTFYGPRGLAVDAAGRVFVVDTGNKRIAVFDPDGNYITEFGEPGLDPGQFDEPVGIAIDKAGIIYVTDVWNQRIQTFSPSEDGLSFTPHEQWDVVGWTGTSLDNKPFIAVDDRGHVFITDPEGARIIEYSTDGQLVQTWGDYGDTSTTFGIAAGIAVDGQGSIWVTDAGNNRVMRFALP